jgi:ribosomal protein S18 acetylase RimI-like enzyme
LQLPFIFFALFLGCKKGLVKDLIFRDGKKQDIPVIATIISTTEAWTCFGIDYDIAMGLFEKMEDLIYIAEKDGEIVGFVTLRVNGVGNIGAYLRMIAVAEKFRGQGIGKQIINYIEEIAYIHTPNVFLICSVENQDAQRFYEKNGFEKIGVMKDLVIKGHDEIWYRKNFGTVR